jgi:hypothetical protein
LQQHKELPAFTPQELAGVSRTQMLRHIEDRRKALAKFEDRLTQDPKVRAFHEEEITHLGAVETYVRMEAPFADRVQPQSALPKALQVSALKPSNVAMWRLGRQSQNIKVDPTPHDSVPKGETKPYAQGEQGLRDYYDAKASAGAAIMGEHHIPGSSAYQNPVFEHLNATVGDYSQYVSFDGLESAAFEAADSDTEAVASEAAAKLSEVYGEMAQERRGIQGMIGQFTDETFKVPT